jgi:hypothetical protein
MAGPLSAGVGEPALLNRTSSPQVLLEPKAHASGVCGAVYEIDPRTNEKLLPTVLYTFPSPLSLIMPIPETIADHGLWKIDTGAAF